MRKILYLAFAIGLLSSCDSGDIEEKAYAITSTGQTVKMTAKVSGLESWDEAYSIALAGFDGEQAYAIMQRALPLPIADGTEIEMELSNLTGQVNTVELALTSPLRERILTLKSINLTDYPETQDTIHMDMGEVNLDLLGCLQKGVFDKACIQCHGGNGGAGAAMLNLTEGHTTDNLVNTPSTRIEGKMRVASGDVNGSLLHQILAEGGENILHVNHTEILSNQFRNNLTEVRQIIDDWIRSLVDGGWKIED